MKKEKAAEGLKKERRIISVLKSIFIRENSVFAIRKSGSVSIFAFVFSDRVFIDIACLKARWGWDHDEMGF